MSRSLIQKHRAEYGWMSGVLVFLALMLGFHSGALTLILMSGHPGSVPSDLTQASFAVSAVLSAGVFGLFVGGTAAGGGALGHLIASRSGIDSAWARIVSVALGSGLLTTLVSMLLLSPLVFTSVKDGSLIGSWSGFVIFAFLVGAVPSALGFAIALWWRRLHPRLVTTSDKRGSITAHE